MPRAKLAVCDLGFVNTHHGGFRMCVRLNGVSIPGPRRSSREEALNDLLIARKKETRDAMRSYVCSIAKPPHRYKRKTSITMSGTARNDAGMMRTSVNEETVVGEEAS